MCWRGFTSLHKELDTSLSQDSLFHRETLLVAAAHDLEDISLELISQLVTADLLSQSLVVELAAEPHKRCQYGKAAAPHAAGKTRMQAWGKNTTKASTQGEGP